MQPYEARQTASLDWRKASFCQTGECVEIAAHDGAVIMRNSSQPDGGYLYFTPEDFGSFLERAKAGEFNGAAS